MAEPQVTPATDSSSPRKPKRRWRKPKPIWIVVGFVIAIALGWLIWHIITAGKESTDDAQVEADVVPLSPRVHGQVAQVFVVENQAVKRGDPILQLDDTDYLSKVHQAQADYSASLAKADAADAQVEVAEAAAKGTFSSAQAQVVGSAASVSGSAADVAAARAMVVRTKANLRKAKLDFQRARELYASEAIPKDRLDAAQDEYSTAKAAAKEAKAKLVAAVDAQRTASERVREAQGKLRVSKPVQAQIDAAVANAKLARAKAESDQAKLQYARLQLQYTRIYAPADGVVSSLAVHPGQYVEAGQAVVQLVPNETYVVANFKETQITHMRVGQRAHVKVDAYPGHKLEGRVESFSGGTGARFALLPPDNATGNYVKVVQRVPVRIAWVKLPRDLPRLRAGLSVEVTVYVNSRSAKATPESGAAPAVGTNP